jgi:hypothetical protein
MKKTMRTLSASFFFLWTTSLYASPLSVEPSAGSRDGWKLLLALLLLIGVLSMMYRSSRRRPVRLLKPSADTMTPPANTPAPPAEIVAAIACALSDSPPNGQDETTPSLTFRTSAGNYTPWNDKVFGLRQIPIKK